MRECSEMLLGIDVGTTGTKCIVVDSCGNILSSAYQGYETINCKVGWAEQNADDWWNAVVSTVRKCTADEGIRKSIVAIGLSSQGGSMVPVDKHCRPLRPAIIWSDKRGCKQKDYFGSNLPENYFYLTTGWKLSSGLNAVQIKWMKDNEPELFAVTYKFLSTIDFITAMLTDKYCIDPSNAGITQLINLHNASWDQRILEMIGITEDKLPQIIDSGEVVGELSCKAAEELGLPKGVKVISGGHDQYCVALGAGVVNPGDVLISTGTAWVAAGIFDKPLFNINTYTSQSIHTVKGKWGSMCSLGTGGVCLEWFRRNMCKAADGTEDEAATYETINTFVSQKPVGAGGILFYPYFCGSSYPNSAPKNKGTFLGMDLSHDRYDIARAIMEGVAFQTIWMLDSLKFDKGINKIKMVGGATKSKIWTQIVADIANKPVIIPKLPDIACIGAAILAGSGSKVFMNVEEGYKNLAAEEETIMPDKQNAFLYKEIYARYKKCSDYITQAYEI